MLSKLHIFIFLTVFLLATLSIRTYSETLSKKVNKEDNLIWKIEETIKIKKRDNLIWKIEETNKATNPLWKGDKRKITKEKIPKFSNFEKNDYFIRAIGRGITVNSLIYPSISNYVPNGYVEDRFKTLTISTRGISKIRHCNGPNFSKNCADAVMDIDFNLINKDSFSFNPKLTIQSLTNRKLGLSRTGTEIGEASSLGFKAAKEFNPKWSIAIGGENIIHLDSKSDLGRNFYIVTSTYYPINKNKEPSILFFNAGIGSDFYGYKGNGYLGNINCLGTPNLTGNGENTCSIGPITSIALAFNSRVSLVSEWFGYGYGAGVSLRPFRKKAVDFSLFATDFIKGFPKYMEENCPHKSCSTRFYGSVNITF